ncbi:hypothetical protein RKE29_22515 [Streptomyces sp. B1866]|uniref:hypothetical protein n=1 Tax=Streptomyces sp. B1866 TaxID=3075431 RepID=UPI00288F79B1|nr:hypothetical protein [Streptomyces sp. B1866]MDT3399386.1 hypothetical protein [Streptomyces sp. B1866]
MERAATEVETELLDLSAVSLDALDGHPGLAVAVDRLLGIAQSPPLSINAVEEEDC